MAQHPRDTARRGYGRRSHSRWRGIWLGLLFCSQTHLAQAAQLDAETEALLVSAVEAAADMDLYNARCRGDVSGRSTDNLNKVMVGKLRTTVLSVLDDLFPEHSYRRAQQRLENDFLSRLRDLGGCQGAKDAGLLEELQRENQEKLDAIRALP